MKNTMKSILVVALTLVCSFTSFSQGQLDALKAIGEGSQFRGYWGVTTENGITTAQVSNDSELKFTKNVVDKMSAFELNKPGKTDNLINSGFGFLEPNHLTQPSVFHSDRHNMAYVYIDGILYLLENVKDPKNITSFKMEKFYLLMKPAIGEHKSGKVLIKEMKTRDHMATIKSYLTEMISVQEKATANFTDEEKKEEMIIIQAKIDKENGVKAKNAAYWNSEEGQKKLGEMNQAKVTLLNDTGSSIYLCYGQGAYSTIKPGEKMEFSCTSGKVYKGTPRANSPQHDRTDKVVLSLDGKGCGNTINASSVY